jgi:hypothetical protein
MEKPPSYDQNVIEAIKMAGILGWDGIIQTANIMGLCLSELNEVLADISDLTVSEELWNDVLDNGSLFAIIPR